MTVKLSHNVLSSHEFYGDIQSNLVLNLTVVLSKFVLTYVVTNDGYTT